MRNLLQSRHLVATFLLAGASIGAMADNVTVTNAEELEAALKSGNEVTVKGTITLDHVIDIKDVTKLTIVGGTISGGNKTALFNIENSYVTIDGTTLKNALRLQQEEEEVRGGAIKVSGGMLTVVGASFEDNEVRAVNVEENFYGGAAINADGTYLDIDDTYFAGNKGYHGGAMMLRNCRGIIQNCEFEENEAAPSVNEVRDGNVRGGGAILVRWEGDANKARKLTVFKCKFVNNHATRFGGAIHFWAGGGDKDEAAQALVDDNVFTVQSCSFQGNYTYKLDEVNEDCGGGAIEFALARPVTVNVFASSFYGNSSRNNGGAIDINDEKEDGCLAKANIVNCTIAGNYITNDGGGNGGGLRMRKIPNGDGSRGLDFALVNTIIVGNKSKADNPGDNLANSDFRLQEACLPHFNRIQNCIIRDLNDRNNVNSPMLPEGHVIEHNFWNTDMEDPRTGEKINDPNSNRIFAGSVEFGTEDGNVIPEGIFDENNGIFWLGENTAEGHIYMVAEYGDADEIAAEYGIKVDQLGNELDRNFVGAANLLWGENEDNSYNEELDVPIIVEEAPEVPEVGETGIVSVKDNAKAADNAYYTISGVRVAQPTKGLYIHNGKKVIK